MTDLRKAAEMALETLEAHAIGKDHSEPITKTIQSLRQALAQDSLRKLAEIDRELGLFDEQALAQPEKYDQTALELCDVCGWKAIIPDEGCLVCARKNQTPVAWSIFDGKSHDVFDTKYDVDNIIRFKKGKVVVIPLYTAPPKREWVGLTVDEIKNTYFTTRADYVDFAKAIEAKLKEKNGG